MAQTGLNVNWAINVAKIPPAGRIMRCAQAWHIITEDKWVLDIMREGYRVPFTSFPNTPTFMPNPPTDSKGEAVLDKEVESMIYKGATRLIEHNSDGVVSPFFARPKSTPGKWRPIVSLKTVNKHIRPKSFRMVTVKDLKLWIREKYYFTSIDLSDAYFSIPLHNTVWKFIRFVWRDLTYEFMVNMFGLAPSARLFTKVLAVVIRFLRDKFAILVQGYIDDFLLQAVSTTLSLVHTHIALIIFHILGFEVNFPKSLLEPSQKIAHLGFDWDSQNMTISVPTKKIVKLQNLTSDFLQQHCCTANELR